jgi:hypothetical protein
MYTFIVEYVGVNGKWNLRTYNVPRSVFLPYTIPGEKAQTKGKITMCNT